MRAVAKSSKNVTVGGYGYGDARMQKRASRRLVRLVACAVLGLNFSVGLTVAGNQLGAVAGIGQVGDQLPPDGVR